MALAGYPVVEHAVGDAAQGRATRDGLGGGRFRGRVAFAPHARSPDYLFRFAGFDLKGSSAAALATSLVTAGDISVPAGHRCHADLESGPQGGCVAPRRVSWQPAYPVTEGPAPLAGVAVFVGWTTLGLTRRWRPERS